MDAIKNALGAGAASNTDTDKMPAEEPSPASNYIAGDVKQGHPGGLNSHPDAITDASSTTAVKAGVTGGEGFHESATHALTGHHAPHAKKEEQGGLQFGESWNPDQSGAANARRAQIMALASSRAEKGAQDELLPDRRSSIQLAETVRKMSESLEISGNPTDRIKAIAGSRAEKGQQIGLVEDSTSSGGLAGRDAEHRASVTPDNVQGRIQALASSRAEKGPQTELLPDDKSSARMVEETRRFSINSPAANPRKASVTPFVDENRRGSVLEQARKASVAGTALANNPTDLSSAETARRESVSNGLAAYAANAANPLTGATGEHTPAGRRKSSNVDASGTEKETSRRASLAQGISNYISGASNPLSGATGEHKAANTLGDGRRPSASNGDGGAAQAESQRRSSVAAGISSYIAHADSPLKKTTMAGES